MDLTKINKKDIKNNTSKVKIAYKNLEDYDKGKYKVDKEKILKEIKTDGKNEKNN